MPLPLPRTEELPKEPVTELPGRDFRAKECFVEGGGTGDAGVGESHKSTISGSLLEGGGGGKDGTGIDLGENRRCFLLLSPTSFCGETGGCLGLLKKEGIVFPDAVFPADAVFPDAAEAEAVEATEAVTEPLLGVDGTLLFFILRVASLTAMEKY